MTEKVHTLPDKWTFLEQIKESDDEEYEKVELISSFTGLTFMSDIMSDTTWDCVREDEIEHVNDRTPEELWKEVFEDCIMDLKMRIGRKIPMHILKKHMCSRQKQEWKQLQQIDLISNI